MNLRLNCRVNAAEFSKKMLGLGYAAGLPASLFYKNMDRIMIVSVTEKRSEGEITAFAEAVRKALS